MNIFLSNFVSALPLFYLFYLIINIITIRTYKIMYLLFYLFISVSVDFLKKSPYESVFEFKDTSILYRPEGAHDCDYLSMRGLEKPNIRAMPSGHMSIVSFFAIVNILILIKSKNINIKMIGILANVTLVILMAWSRMSKLCHNKYQVFFGTIYGSFIGILYSYFF